jgi:hypothetical protein
MRQPIADLTAYLLCGRVPNPNLKSEVQLVKTFRSNSYDQIEAMRSISSTLKFTGLKHKKKKKLQKTGHYSFLGVTHKAVVIPTSDSPTLRP